MNPLFHEELTRDVIGAAIEVHKEIGPGLLESAYETCLCHELSLRRLEFQRQVSLPALYKNVKLDCGYRIDLIVEKNGYRGIESHRECHARPRSTTDDLLKTIQTQSRPPNQLQRPRPEKRHHQASLLITKGKNKLNTETRRHGEKFLYMCQM